MASKITFCTGGSRSGKSSFALKLADKIAGPKLFVATAEARDPEMLQRIRLHQQQRGHDWHCFEVPVSQSCRLAELLPLALLGSPGEGGNGPRAVLVDCLSTWVSACQESWNGAPTDLFNGVLDAFDDVMHYLSSLDLPVFLVSAETGMGLVSTQPDIRQYCDLLGAVNQRAAAAAGKAFFCVSGMPLELK